MLGNMLTVFLSLVVVVEAFIQRYTDGSASAVMILGGVVAMLYLVSTFIHVITNFAMYKHQFLLKRRER